MPLSTIMRNGGPDCGPVPARYCQPVRLTPPPIALSRLRYSWVICGTCATTHRRSSMPISALTDSNAWIWVWKSVADSECTSIRQPAFAVRRAASRNTGPPK